MRQSLRAKYRKLKVGGGFLVLVIVLSFLFSPSEREEYEILREGDIAPKDIISPFTFEILKTPEQLSHEQEEAAQKIAVVLHYDIERTKTQEAEVDKFFDKAEYWREMDRFYQEKEKGIEKWGMPLSKSTISVLLGYENLKGLKREVRATITEILNKGLLPILPSEVQTLGIKGLLKRPAGNIEIKLEELFNLESVRFKIRTKSAEIFPASLQLQKAFEELTVSLLSPNVLVEQKETERLRQVAKESVPVSSGTVKKGEKIIGAHEQVGLEEIQKLRSLRFQLEKLSLEERGWGPSLPFFSRFLFLAIVVFVLLFWLYHFRPQIFAEDRFLVLISVIILLTLLMTKVIVWQEISPYLIPLAYASILITLLLELSTALFLTVLLSLLAGFLANFNFSLTVLGLVGGMVVAYSVRHLRHRYEFFLSIGLLCLVNLVVIVILEIIRYSSFSKIFEFCKSGVGNGLLTGFLVMGTLPILEIVFRTTTAWGLLELADLNHPLLRRLSVEAPGTYQHSLLIGSLAEAAAESIGVDSLLARVSAYYHDIGKLRKPEYFIENQVGIKNRHDHLSPKMSSLVVISHVKEGLDFGKKARLPQPLLNCIAQHHGTTLLKFFYHKALRMNPSETKILASDYRYPGPKPQTKEIGIVMLADSVEAASRALRQPTPDRLQKLIKMIITEKFNEFELDDCALSLQDLHKIGETFLPILAATFHPRVEYESEETKKDASAKLAV
ncbi:MAG: HDIG domain-containing metalloprotein [Candidatus Edwardsbacteria bacterium]